MIRKEELRSVIIDQHQNHADDIRLITRDVLRSLDPDTP